MVSQKYIVPILIQLTAQKINVNKETIYIICNHNIIYIISEVSGFYTVAL